jgi:hypothetical protein
MTTLERKVDALAKVVLADDHVARELAIEELKLVMDDGLTRYESEMDMIRNHTEALLMEIGVPCHHLGFNDLIIAISMVVENPQLGSAITKSLYPGIAKRGGNGRTAQQVERGIRHSIEYWTINVDSEVIDRYFGNSISINKAKPTNAQFIITLAREVKRRVYGV